MRLLILEDQTNRVKFFIEQFCDHEVTVTENAYAAIDYLEDNVYDCIFLDNDLGDGNGSGLLVAGYLSKHQTNPNTRAKVFIHSWNIPAAYQMKEMLPGAIVLPFSTKEYSCVTLDK
jgi:DNA-binding LytR/AlgR family response regulator